MSKFRRQLMMASVPLPPPPPPPFYTTLGYVNDGLVAMWDGIYNANTETHDSSATTWVEMVSNTPSNVFTDQVVNNDSLTIGSTLILLSPTVNFSAEDIIPNRPYTVEMVAEEVTKAADSTAASGVYVRGLHQLGYFRHQNNNAWGPDVFRISNIYVAMSIDGLTYNQIYPKANKSFVVSNWSSVNTTNARDKVAVYYNGTLRSAHRYTFSSGSAPTENGVIYIGGSSTGKFKYYNIRIYNRALTAEEIAANYAVDAQRFIIT